MEAEKNINISERFQGEEPEIFAVDHAADFDSYHDRLQEAEADYREACAAFLAENPAPKPSWKLPRTRNVPRGNFIPACR